MSASVSTSAAPTGLVALVFTDVQGSTQMWDAAAETMRVALDVHNRVVREVLVETGGYEVKTEGDAFILAFNDAVSAVRCCLLAQERLLEASWPDSLLALEAAEEETSLEGRRIRRGLRVRMGVHLGEPVCRPDPVTGRMDYFGPAMNRAARIAAAGHGGQILVSDRVWRAVEPKLEYLAHPVVTDLGEHRLKDLESVERLRQIVPVALERRTFPPIRTIDAKKTNLSAHPTPFIGRKADLVSLAELLSRDERLVTVLGPGGTGKTRLTQRYAAVHLDDYSGEGGGGVWFCDLTEARSLDGICAAVGRALAVPLTTGKTSADTITQLGNAIAGRGRVLLVLDNFEQVAALAPETVGQWLVAAPEARFLVSSQERLKLPGEAVHELTPLAWPDDPEKAEESEAVQLFVQRASAVRREWRPATADWKAIADIVKELDGIPLAIELAAARIGVLSPAKILERLPRRFDLLGGARRDATSRQATLRGAIDWSWNLLRPHERDALAQCSVFQGGFSMESAEAVLDLREHPGAPWPLDVVQSLRDKSLLRAWEPAGSVGDLRFGMYNNIREYAAEKLVASGKATSTVARHATHFLDAAGEWVKGVDTHGDLERLRRIALELDNLSAILQREAGLDPPTSASASQALRAVFALDPVLSSRGPFGVHLDWLDAAIAAGQSAGAPIALLAEAYESRGRARRVRGRTQEAQADLAKAQELARAAGAPAVEARAFAQVGFVHYQQGSLDEAERVFENGLRIARESGSSSAEATLLNYLGIVAMDRYEIEPARDRFESALAIHRAAGNLRGEGLVLGNLGVVLRRQGHLVEAQAMYERALEIHRVASNVNYEGNELGKLASVFQELDKVDLAREYYRQALSIHRDVGNLPSGGIFHGNLGILELLQLRFDDAVWHLRESVGMLARAGDRRHGGLYRAYLAAAYLSVGLGEASAREFENARAHLEKSGDASFLLVLEVLELLVSKRSPNEIATRIDEVAGSREAQRSEDVRFACRIVRRNVTKT